MTDVVKNTLNFLRTQKGVTQEQLAEALGVSRQTIIAMEKGNYTPSVSLALKISYYFKIPVEKIFTIAYEK